MTFNETTNNEAGMMPKSKTDTVPALDKYDTKEVANLQQGGSFKQISSGIQVQPTWDLTPEPTSQQLQSPTQMWSNAEVVRKNKEIEIVR